MKGKKIILKEIFSLGNLLIFAAICILATPFVLSYYGGMKKAEIIQTTVASMSPEERAAYNERLKRDFAENESLPEISHTPKTIFSTHIKPIGILSIPKIEEKLPIYMGISEDALALGTAILDKTSYPTGELGTNTVITGHRGVPSQNIFKNLDKVEKGDFVYVDLNEENILRFKVSSIEVVEPHQIDKFQLHEDRAMVTLVTCTPYLINSHRILIFADLDSMIKNPNFGKDKDDKESLKEKDNLLRAASESEIRKNEKEEEIIVRNKGNEFWYKIRLMNPINLAIGFIFVVLGSQVVFNFFHLSTLKSIVNLFYKMVAILGFLIGFAYILKNISLIAQ